MGNPAPALFLCAEEARYEDGRFVLPEEQEEQQEEAEDEEQQVQEPNSYRKISARIQARVITGLLALLEAIFKIINFLITLLSKIV